MVEVLLGIGMVLGPCVLIYAAVRTLTVRIEEDHAALITSFGKLVRVEKQPGLHWLPSRALPWVNIKEFHLGLDGRSYDSLHINDSTGTSMSIDLWIEFKIVDPVKASFAVEDWDRALKTVVCNDASELLGALDFRHILQDRSELGENLQRVVNEEASRWGLEVTQAFLKTVTVRPELIDRLTQTMAAQLLRAKAEIEEHGKMAVAKLEAETDCAIAELQAHAKGQYPLAVSRAFESLRTHNEVLVAYQRLYKLSQLERTSVVVFDGSCTPAMAGLDALLTGQNTGTRVKQG